MRSLAFGFGILAILVAALLAANDNSARRSSSGAAVQPTVGPATAAAQPARASFTEHGPAGGVFFVARPDAFAAFDSFDGQLRYYLPRGLFSADGNHFYWTRLEPAGTVVYTQNLETGLPEQNHLVVPGRWTLGAVSASGEWLALRGPGVGPQTQIAVAGALTGTIRPLINLDGNFDVDAISSDGVRLFLIEHLPATQANRYAVRLYNLLLNQLQPGSVRIKGETEDMVGEAAARLGSSDGHWLLTLYLNTEKNEAFVHSLNLWEGYALCLDLPSDGATLEQLAHYSLALAPDGNTLYAVNPALGVVTALTLDGSREEQIVRYTPGASGRQPPADIAPGRWSLAAPDGARLYFTDGESIWAFDAKSGEVAGPLQVGPSIAGLALNPSGDALYVVSEGPGPTLVLATNRIATRP